ncbi:MAG: hypothetical protein N2323_06655 [candidate division WOR-3 bacterium]|nr:hypothetical protein [candidate division WOR-3 bacterium]
MKRLIIFIFLIFLSCGLFKKEEEPFPLAVDNWWAYQITEQGRLMPKELKSSIFKRLSKSPATYIDTLKIIGKQTIAGVDGYVAFSTYSRDTIGIFYYKNDYLWLHHSEEDTFTEKVFPEKPKIGDNWVGYEEKDAVGDIDFDGISDSMRMKSEYNIILKENINVLAGSFKDCYRAQMNIILQLWLSSEGNWETQFTATGNLWMKTGVGMVKQDITGYETWELIKYNVK